MGRRDLQQALGRGCQRSLLRGGFAPQRRLTEVEIPSRSQITDRFCGLASRLRVDCERILAPSSRHARHRRSHDGLIYCLGCMGRLGIRRESSGHREYTRPIMSLIIFGAYGVFGSWLSQELAVSGIPFTIAGRDRQKAEALAEQLHGKTRVQVADINDPSSCLEALRDHHIAIHCAGPFSNRSTALIEACWQAGCHYVDIADDRKYLARVRRYGEVFREKGLSAVYGCSSLPGISGALALLLKRENPL